MESSGWQVIYADRRTEPAVYPHTPAKRVPRSRDHARHSVRNRADNCILKPKCLLRSYFEQSCVSWPADHGSGGRISQTDKQFDG
jgi:hypothetical protein